MIYLVGVGQVSKIFRKLRKSLIQAKEGKVKIHGPFKYVEEMLEDLESNRTPWERFVSKYWWPIDRLFWKIFYFFSYDIPRGTKNLIYYFPVIWNDMGIDHYYITRLMEHKLKRDYEIRNGKWKNWYVGQEKDDKALLTAIYLLGRINRDDYLGNYEKIPEKVGFTDWHVYEEYMKKQDLDYLCKVINKHLFTWWV